MASYDDKIINGQSLKHFLDKVKTLLSSKQDTIGDLSTIRTNASTGATHASSTANPHNVTKTQIGLGNVENKSSETIRGELTSANVTTALGYTPPTTDTNTTYSAGSNITQNGTVFSLTKTNVTSALGYTPPTTNTTYTTATTSANGLMSATDKTKLDGIAEGADNVADSSTNGNILINGTETNIYTLPSATSSALGGVKLTLDGTTLYITT